MTHTSSISEKAKLFGGIKNQGRLARSESPSTSWKDLHHDETARGSVNQEAEPIRTRTANLLPPKHYTTAKCMLVHFPETIENKLDKSKICDLGNGCENSRITDEQPTESIQSPIETLEELDDALQEMESLKSIVRTMREDCAQLIALFREDANKVRIDFDHLSEGLREINEMQQSSLDLADVQRVTNSITATSNFAHIP